MKNTRNEEIFKEAQKYIPGGVNSPVRAFKSVDRVSPIFAKRGAGSHIWDEDDNEYIDYICSWGPLILGHNPQVVLDGVKEVLNLGSSFGLPTKGEVDLAKLITECYPAIEMVRLTTSGTEATMSAIRLARAYTKRNKIIKFDGCYHGHSDALLVKSGSGLLTQNIQDSNGITSGVLQDTITLPFGDTSAIEKELATNEIACIIIEPIPANMGVIPTDKKFLEDVRNLTTKYGTLLIFDEVITGFRLSLGGASEYFGITPDLTTLGKIIGGGYPVGAFGGKKEIMQLIAPVGRVYHAGTLSGNPISVRAGLETIKYLRDNKDTLYPDLAKKVEYITRHARDIASNYGVPVIINSVGSLFTIFFTDATEIKDMTTATSCNTDHFAIYFNDMLNRGVICPPSQFEAHFVSITHTQKDLDDTLICMEHAFKKIGEYIRNGK